MDEKQTQMWDTLAELGGEEVLRVLTDWHGLQLLDDGFYGHLVDEGYIDEPEEEEAEPEEEEETNCESGTYDCDTCTLNGKCERQDAMDAAMEVESFDEFCEQFPACKGCPIFDLSGDCESEVWPGWKVAHSYE